MTTTRHTTELGNQGTWLRNRCFALTLQVPMLYTAFVSSLLIALFVGCSGDSKTAKQKQTSHLRTLVSLFNASSRAQGGVPRSEDEFRKYIVDKGLPVLKRLGIQTVDDLFISERDGQPFVVFYGPKKPHGVRADVVAHEQSGIDGVRQVGFNLGMIEDVDATEFPKLVPEGVQTQ